MGILFDQKNRISCFFNAMVYYASLITLCFAKHTNITLVSKHISTGFVRIGKHNTKKEIEHTELDNSSQHIKLGFQRDSGNCDCGKKHGE